MGQVWREKGALTVEDTHWMYWGQWNYIKDSGVICEGGECILMDN